MIIRNNMIPYTEIWELYVVYLHHAPIAFAHSFNVFSCFKVTSFELSIAKCLLDKYFLYFCLRGYLSPTCV